MATLSDEQIVHLVQTGQTTALANKAVLACLMNGKQPSLANVMQVLEKWLDRDADDFEEVLVLVGAHITQMVEAFD